MDKVAILIVNFNMPERTDALAQHIIDHVKWPYRLIVIDNGSDLIEQAKHTNFQIPENRQTTGGWLAGLRYADTFQEQYLAYWFLITSAEFVGDDDPLTPLAELLMEKPEAVGVHPALTEDSTTAWKHLITRIPKDRAQDNGREARRTWMIDNIASLWRADWFNSIGRFDPALIYGWGIDLETCWKARDQRRSLWVHEGCRVKKVTDIGYTMNRMKMTAGQRGERAGNNMAAILSDRYGRDWWKRMMKDNVTDEML